MSADQLRAGDALGEASGDLVVVSSTYEAHPGGLTVYNFEVDGPHTYFVDDGQGDAAAVWVHNTCQDARQLRNSMTAAGRTPQKYAAHIVPTGKFSNRAQHVQDALEESRGILRKHKIGAQRRGERLLHQRQSARGDAYQRLLPPDA